jgi:hypothetical protein
MAIFCENNYFVCQSYGKRHNKALGKTRNQRSLAEGKSKSDAEGVGLNSG